MVALPTLEVAHVAYRSAPRPRLAGRVPATVSLAAGLLLPTVLPTALGGPAHAAA
ncbi:hypothetical protein [Streptomyces sp. HPF1205]|uniref:hypothetical protein n=1 Tax=Streptomyces sp. HPF1205 TaxID=2873262 RepID=UPI001CECDAF8|nr:hypothetical protein [Streptomyces sp. HPF1205]